MLHNVRGFPLPLPHASGRAASAPADMAGRFLYVARQHAKRMIANAAALEQRLLSLSAVRRVLLEGMSLARQMTLFSGRDTGSTQCMHSAAHAHGTRRDAVNTSRRHGAHTVRPAAPPPGAAATPLLGLCPGRTEASAQSLSPEPQPRASAQARGRTALSLSLCLLSSQHPASYAPGASGLIAVHGQAMAWVLFLPEAQRTAAIEIFPGSSNQPIYRTWCRVLGIRYARLTAPLAPGCVRADKMNWLSCNLTVNVEEVVQTTRVVVDWLAGA